MRRVPKPRRQRVERTQERIEAFMREEGGCWTARGLAEALGLPLNTARVVMHRMRMRGVIACVGKRQRFGRPAYLYEALK